MSNETPLPLIDTSRVELLRSIAPDKFIEIVNTFYSSTEKNIALVESSLAESDWVTLHRAAHSLKGSAGTIGAPLLRVAAEKLELAARDQLPEVKTLAPQIFAVYQQTVQSLKAFTEPN